MDDGDSDFEENDGDQDTMDIDDTPVPLTTGNSSLRLVHDY